MKVIVVLEVDPDTLFGSHCSGSVPPELNTDTVGELVEKELGWLTDSGMNPIGILEPDEISSNDATLGGDIRKHLIK